MSRSREEKLGWVAKCDVTLEGETEEAEDLNGLLSNSLRALDGSSEFLRLSPN